MLLHFFERFSPCCRRVLVACHPETHQSETKQRIVMSRARNPRFYFVHAGTKPRFLTKKGHPKSGIPCSGHVIACVCIFVNPSCKYFTSIQTHPSENKATHRYAMFFCNHLAKLLQKIEASQKNLHIASHATIFCNHLAKLLQKVIANEATKNCAISGPPT